MSEESLNGLTAEAVLAITKDLLTGQAIPPRWLCMSDEAKARYQKEGEELMRKFKADEIAFKQARESGNPRGFFFPLD